MIRPIVDPPLVVIATLLLLGLAVWGAAWSPSGERMGWLRRGLVVLLLGFIALRPGLGAVPAATRPSDLEVLLVVDRTTSMSARDWNGELPRLHGVRRDVMDLVDALPSSRFTLVTFGKTVRTRLPSTSDVTLISEALSLIRREEVFDGTGSRVDRPVARMEQLLTRVGEQHPDRRRIVVLLTDGENTQPGAQRSFSPLDPLVDAGVVLGYGTKRGGRMPMDAKHLDLGWVEDVTTGRPALSRLDEVNLRLVAGEMGIGYVHRRSPGGLEGVAAAWEQSFSERPEESGDEAPAKVELVWMMALALMLVALLDLRQHWRRFWQTRRELA